LSHRDTVAALIFLGGGFHFKAIESSTLDPDPNLRQVRANLAIEAILVHAKETGRVAQSDKARRHWHTDFNNHRRPAAPCGSGRLGSSCHVMRIICGGCKKNSLSFSAFSAKGSVGRLDKIILTWLRWRQRRPPGFE
jgi:hypothetical protein